MPPTIRADRLRATSLVALLGLAAGACGVFGGGRTPEPGQDGATAGTRLERPRQSCGDARLPLRLPAAAEVIDTPAVLIALAGDANWQRAGTFLVLSLTFDGGQALYPVVVRTNLPPLGKQAPGEALAALVREHLLPQAATDSAWGVRAELRGGSSPVLRIARQEICRPRALGSATGYISSGRQAIPFAVADRPTSFAMAEQPVSRPIPLRVLVDADGTVVSVDVPPVPELGASPDLTRAIEQAAPGVRFYPALRDGVPERAWAPLWAIIGALR